MLTNFPPELIFPKINTENFLELQDRAQNNKGFSHVLSLTRIIFYLWIIYPSPTAHPLIQSP